MYPLTFASLCVPSVFSVYAYEVDGFGGAHLMDDANSPSLLSLPYLGYVDVDDDVYQRTRALIWSSEQGYFWNGTAGSGIGGPHVGIGQIWPVGTGRGAHVDKRTHPPDNWADLVCLAVSFPSSVQMSLILFALTSTSDDEILSCLSTLVRSSAGTGLLHESFDKDDVDHYTRPWFAWVNGLFGELMMKIADERPHLIFNQEHATQKHTDDRHAQSAVRLAQS